MNAKQKDKRSELNGLTAAEWVPLTTSVFTVPNHEPGWDTKREHPGTYPIGVPARFIRMFTRRGETVLDPFSGAGTTVIAAAHAGRRGLGVELYPAWVDLSRRLMDAHGAAERKGTVQTGLGAWGVDGAAADVSDAWGEAEIITGDALDTVAAMPAGSVDFVMTSPPYANALQIQESSTELTRQAQRRAEGLALDYGEDPRDAGLLDMPAWLGFMRALGRALHAVVRPGRWLCMAVQNIVTKDRLLPLSWLLGIEMERAGWTLTHEYIWWQKHKAGRVAGFPARPMQSNHHTHCLVWRRDDDA